METILDLILGGTELQLTGFLVLCAVSFLGSMIAASLGLGGGLLVIATMALYLSPAVLIPVHGVVQLGSNLGRTVLMARHVLKSVLPAFVAGEHDPEVDYSYSEDGTTLELSPRDNIARQMGAMT